MADNIDEKDIVSTDETAAVEDSAPAVEDSADKKTKSNKKAVKQANAPAVSWRSKEKEKPLFLDKHKVVFWVLVGVALVGLVMAIIPFVVDVNDGQSGNPWQIYIDRLQSAGYDVEVYAPDSDELAEVNAANVAAGSPSALWMLNGMNGEEIVVIRGMESAEVASQYAALTPASASVGNVILTGTANAMTVALGTTFVPDTSNIWQNADLGYSYLNSIKNYFFTEYSLMPMSLYFEDSAQTNNFETQDEELARTVRDRIADMATNDGELSSPGVPTLILTLVAQNASSDVGMVFVIGYETDGIATQVAENIDGYSEQISVRNKGNVVIIARVDLVDSRPDTGQGAALADAVYEYLE